MTTNALPRDLWRAATAQPPDGGWAELHDRVMGGRSTGTALLIAENTDSAAHLRLTGRVSLDRGGGFASFRSRLASPQRLDQARSVVLVLRGDGGPYKCCLHRHAEGDGVQWQVDLVAQTDWVTVTLPLGHFVARRRGRPMNERPWQPDDAIHQIGILAVRSAPGPFNLCLASIALV